MELTIILAADGIGFVNDDPIQEYESKRMLQLLKQYRRCFNANSFTAAGIKDGQSTVTLDIAGAAATTQCSNCEIAKDPENNDLQQLGANVVVQLQA